MDENFTSDYSYNVPQHFYGTEETLECALGQSVIDVYFADKTKGNVGTLTTPWTPLTHIDDPVNHPKHYTSHPSGVECIDITQHYNFCVGNAIKYLWRNGLKADSDNTAKDKQIEDLKKAVWYINKEISNLESRTYE
jgi:hypothetical protein